MNVRTVNAAVRKFRSRSCSGHALWMLLQQAAKGYAQNSDEEQQVTKELAWALVFDSDVGCTELIIDRWIRQIERELEPGPQIEPRLVESLVGFRFEPSENIPQPEIETEPTIEGQPQAEPQAESQAAGSYWASLRERSFGSPVVD